MQEQRKKEREGHRRYAHAIEDQLILQVVHEHHQQERAEEDADERVKRHAELAHDKQRDEPHRGFDQRVLPRDRLLAVAALSPQRDKAHDRHEVGCRQCVLAPRAVRPSPRRGIADVQPVNHDVAEAAEGSAEDEGEEGKQVNRFEGY